MRLRLLIFAATLPLTAQTPQPFTLQQVLSAPYASNLTAAPTGNLFAWVEDTEGRHNLWIGGPNQPARQLTHNTEDDAQDITQLAWSPDAKAIAYTYGAATGADGKPANPAHLQHATPVQIILQPVAPDAQPAILGEGRSPLFTLDGHSLLFLRAGQIWTVPIPGSQPAPPCPTGQTICPLPISDRRFMGPSQLVYDRGSASGLTLSPDGHTLAFLSHRTERNQPSHTFLALFDLTTSTLTFPAPSTANDLSPAFSPNGHQLAWLRQPFTAANTAEFATNRTSANPWSIQLLDLASNTTRTAYSPEPNKPGSVLPHLATGEPRLFVYHDPTYDDLIAFPSESSGHVALYLLSTQPKSQPFRISQPDADVEDVALSTDGNELLYAANSPQDPDRRHIRSATLPQSEGNLGEEQWTHGNGIETHPVGTRGLEGKGAIAALIADAQHPMQPALIDIFGHMTPLHPEPTSASHPASALVTPTQILLPSTDNLALHAQLFLPRQNADSSAALRNDKGRALRNDKSEALRNDKQEKLPAILYLHGGPQRQSLLGYPPGEYYSNAYAFNQYLASRGFIVLSVNYRGGTGYGLDFRQCEHCGPTGAAEYADVLAAQRYLASRPDVDPKRIGVWGGSYGGYLTALALARNSNLFAAGVDFHGVHDWNLEDNAADWKRGTNAEQDAIAATALASSPLADISHWTSPILLIHGDNDPDVAYVQTPILADRLRAQNTHVEELIFPDETHNFQLHKDWLTAYEAAAAFFERTLKP